MRYKAVIFDLDGTLLNTLDDLADSANHILNELGFPAHPTESYKYFVGNGIPKLIERCLPADKQEYKEKALKMFFDYYNAHSRDKTAPYTGITELISDLKKSGLKLGVITNKANPIAREVVDFYLGGENFGYVQGMEEGLCAKPNPKGALMVAEKLGVTPDEVLYIGDSGVDMLTAVNAGFTPCGVLWGFRKEDELRDNGALYIVNKPSDIIALTEE